VRKILLVALVAAIIPAVAHGQRADSGLLTLCSASGARPATGTFTFTLSTVAAAGGTTTLNIPVGTCAARVFYPEGVSVTVTQSVPNGYAVTGITLAPTKDGPGTTTVVTSNTPSAGSAAVTIGSGQATLTFTTSGPTGAASACKVPNVFGLTFAAAKSAVLKAHCTVGTVRKVYSDLYYPDRVYSQSPQRGAVLAPHGRVSLTVSLGHRP
jgi:PASTA domain